MSSSGGVSTARIRGENRFYVSPAMRKQQQQQQLQQLQQQQKQQRQQSKPSISKNSMLQVDEKLEADNAGLPPYKSLSSGRLVTESNSTNLDRFLEYTTPVVPAQFPPKSSLKGWRNKDSERHPFFNLGDLWEYFKEWSAYGAGVPLVLNGSETVMQYYVPYLSGIQLYVDPERPSSRLRRPGGDSDAESSRETSSDGSGDYVAERGSPSLAWVSWTETSTLDSSIRNLNRLAIRKQPLESCSSDDCDNSNHPGQLIFEYMEHSSPFTRQPLADKISALASSQCGELKTLKSCDLSPSSWMSVAWYPIYRIPMGPTLQNLDACFLTFHSLSTPIQCVDDEGGCGSGAGARQVYPGDACSVRLPLPAFGLASYKFKVLFWNPNDVYENQKVSSLLIAADSWLRLLKVTLPDYIFFVSHNSG